MRGSGKGKNGVPEQRLKNDLTLEKLEADYGHFCGIMAT